MLRRAQSSGTDGEWKTVSNKQPCRVCGSREACRTGYGEEFACCSRRVSEWPLTTGGWLHRLEAPTSERPDAA